jgi:hypothetical protein
MGSRRRIVGNVEVLVVGEIGWNLELSVVEREEGWRR